MCAHTHEHKLYMHACCHSPQSPAGVALWECSQQLQLILVATGKKGEAEHQLLTARVRWQSAADKHRPGKSVSKTL
jgi:hypothetical protein